MKKRTEVEKYIPKERKALIQEDLKHAFANICTIPKHYKEIGS